MTLSSLTLRAATGKKSQGGRKSKERKEREGFLLGGLLGSGSRLQEKAWEEEWLRCPESGVGARAGARSCHLIGNSPARALLCGNLDICFLRAFCTHSCKETEELRGKWLRAGGSVLFF